MKRKKKTKIQLLEEKLNKKWIKECSEKYGNEICEVCGNPFSAFHHWIPKSRSLHLRYDVKNGVPLCVKCHYKIHFSHKPTEIQEICNIIENKRGKEWVSYIKENEKVKVHKTLNYLQKLYEN